MVLLGVPGAAAQGGIVRSSLAAPANLGDLRLPAAVAAPSKINTQLGAASGRVSVVVRLSKAPAALMTDQQAQGVAIAAEQDAVIARIGQIDASARVLGRARLLVNVVMVEMDAAKLAALAADVRVAAINPVVDFALDLSETVPYIGATPEVQGAVNGGAGVTVAVLDSGIDYSHVAFGGAGTQAAYQAVYGTSTGDPKNTTRDGLFPTAKVVEGYDFVGEAWPNGDLTPDADPIDCGGPSVSDGCDGGHGTHVADIIGGATGVAPGVSLYAVKVCSAVSTSCSGVALIQGMEYAVDPNGDGKTTDHVDIVNMSLGSPYGDFYFDDLSTAVEHASKLGVLTVASAGNSADRPYIVGTPSAAPSALSVAQTQVPSAKSYPLVVNSPASIAGQHKNTATVDWAPIGAGFSGDVVYLGTACPGEALLANPAGKVALIDRGDCAVSLKTSNAAAAGAIGVLIGLLAPGDPFSFSYGGGAATAPTLIITQADANQIKANLAAPVNVSVSDAVSVPLVGSVVSSSSRGPSIGRSFSASQLGYWFNERIKPEIGAPGASISALVGTGTQSAAFGGTSGAAPMAAGAAALVWAGNPRLSPGEVKALLMNTAETAIYTNPVMSPGVLAPITRIGNGEVRVDRALAAGASAVDILNGGGSLSFGFIDVSRKRLPLCRTVEVKNYTGKPITYGVASSFRYADDEANGAVRVMLSRQSVTIPAHRVRHLYVCLEIEGAKLRPWSMNSGPGGGSPTALNQLEYDGYITFTDLKNADNNLHMAWHVLPRLSPMVRVSDLDLGDEHKDDVEDSDHYRAQRNPALFTLKNRGVGAGSYSVFSLIGENPTAPRPGAQGSQNPAITARYFGAVTYAVPPTLCTSGVLAQFAVQTWRPVAHANYPVEVRVELDTNRDGQADYVAYTAELNGASAFAADGRNVVYAGPIGGTATAFFYTQHGTNSGAFVLNVCGEQVGLSSTAAGALVDVHAYTYDNYFTGEVTSHIAATMSILNERYVVTDPDGAAALSTLTLPANSRADYGLYDFGAAGASPTEGGLLLMNTSGGASEVLAIRVPRCTKGDASYRDTYGSSACR